MFIHSGINFSYSKKYGVSIVCMTARLGETEPLTTPKGVFLPWKRFAGTLSASRRNQFIFWSILVNKLLKTVSNFVLESSSLHVTLRKLFPIFFIIFMSNFLFSEFLTSSVGVWRRWVWDTFFRRIDHYYVTYECTLFYKDQ